LGEYGLADIGGMSFAQTLFEAVTSSSTRGAVLDHLRDLRLRARILHAAVVAAAGAVVRLHEAGVRDAVVRRGRT